MSQTLTLNAITQMKKKLDKNDVNKVVLKCSHLWTDGGKAFSSHAGVEVCEKCASEISKELAEKMR